jgi:hypothetical protein
MGRLVLAVTAEMAAAIDDAEKRRYLPLRDIGSCSRILRRGRLPVV